MIRLITEEGQELDLKDYQFTISYKKEHIGTIIVGSLRSGDCIACDHDGMHIRYQDGTKYFVNYSWFQ